MKQSDTKQLSCDWSLFDQALQHGIAHSEQLIAVLQLERKALETRDYANLETLIGQKKSWVEALEKNATERKNWLSTNGLPNDFDALVAVKEQAPTVAIHWETAASLWRECQTANQLNEQICRRTRLVVERVLDILRGQHAQSATYDAKGVSQRGQPGRTISNA